MVTLDWDQKIIPLTVPQAGALLKAGTPRIVCWTFLGREKRASATAGARGRRRGHRRASAAAVLPGGSAKGENGASTQTPRTEENGA